MKTSLHVLCLYCAMTAVAFISLILINEPAAAADANFACGGSVEAEVWEAWDGNVRDYLRQNQLDARLLKQGDVYALYDIQTYAHNMVSMASRCKRINRLKEVAGLIRIAYDALEPGNQSSPGRRWVCRGGSICNDKNRLLNQEVMLDSVQFLGLASRVANALASSGRKPDEEEKAFIQDTGQILVEHLLRWGSESAISSMRQATGAKPEDVTNGSSKLFFTDKPLWMITMYAELAGIIQSGVSKDVIWGSVSKEDKMYMQKHCSALLEFFSSRISIRHDPKSRLRDVALADIDRGFWRLYYDNRYAGYESDQKPAVCVLSEPGKSKKVIKYNVMSEKVQKRDDTGWDISHARRLVHAMDALERNRVAMKNVFSLTDVQLSSSELAKAFANTLVAVIWNGDMEYPLFSNYFSGANGWFRVAYDNKTGQCREGTRPFGMTVSFPTGGYITWARYNPTIGLLGQRLYELTSSDDGKANPFIVKYYKGLKKSVPVQNINLARFMFLPSLVGIPNEK